MWEHAALFKLMASSKICYAPSFNELQIQSEAYNEILIWLLYENRLGKLLKSIASNFPVIIFLFIGKCMEDMTRQSYNFF